MQIFVIFNPTQNTTNYVCDSQTTIDAGQTAGYNGLYSIGTQDDANSILATNQQSWLNHQVNEFCVNKNLITDDGDIEWITVNLSTEPQNTDVIYRLLNVPNGDWVSATGLNAAQTKFATIQQNYLVFCGLGSVISRTSWPVKPI
jgi:hypothetical protein